MDKLLLASLVNLPCIIIHCMRDTVNTNKDFPLLLTIYSVILTLIFQVSNKLLQPHPMSYMANPSLIDVLNIMRKKKIDRQIRLKSAGRLWS